MAYPVRRPPGLNHRKKLYKPAKKSAFNALRRTIKIINEIIVKGQQKPEKST